MIKIEVSSDGKTVYDNFEEHDATLQECALVSFRLSQIISNLQNKEFDSELEVTTGDFANED